jgi:hypothetical protein
MSVLLLHAGASNHRALLSHALRLANQEGIQLDRIARRSKECLIVWFCENCPWLLVDPLRLTVEQAPPRESLDDDPTDTVETFPWSDDDPV